VRNAEALTPKALAQGEFQKVQIFPTNQKNVFVEVQKLEPNLRIRSDQAFDVGEGVADKFEGSERCASHPDD